MNSSLKIITYPHLAPRPVCISSFCGKQKRMRYL